MDDADTVTLCDDCTAPPEHITFSHRVVWTDEEGWRVVSGMPICRPDAANKVLWIRRRLKDRGTWRWQDIAFDWNLLKDWMQEG